jgi:hypothetical protein
MTNEIEQVAKQICLCDGQNPLERLDAGDEVIFRWEAYTPRARAAINKHLDVLIKEAKSEREEVVNTVVEAMCLEYFIDRLKQQIIE